MVPPIKEGAQSSSTTVAGPQPLLADLRPSLQKQQRQRGLRTDSIYFSRPQFTATREHASREHGADSWRFKVVERLHSPQTHKILMSLLACDVVLLFLELFLLATFPPCSVIEKNAYSCCPESAIANWTLAAAAAANEDAPQHDGRFLQENNDETLHSTICNAHNDDYTVFGEAACDEHKWHAVHVMENVIFSFTMVILSLFFIELNLMMIALGPRSFFCQFFFTLDYVIVLVSLVLEAVFYANKDDIYQSLAGILVAVRIWRFVRIGHGIGEVTHELAQEEYHKLEHYKDQLEALLGANNVPVPGFETGGPAKPELILAVEQLHHSGRPRDSTDTGIEPPAAAAAADATNDQTAGAL